MESTTVIDWAALYKELRQATTKVRERQQDYFAARKQHRDGKAELEKSKGAEAALRLMFVTHKYTIQSVGVDKSNPEEIRYRELVNAVFGMRIEQVRYFNDKKAGIATKIQLEKARRGESIVDKLLAEADTLKQATLF